MLRRLVRQTDRVLWCGAACLMKSFPPRCGSASREINHTNHSMIRALCFLFVFAAVASAFGYDLLTKGRLRWADGDVPMSLQLDATMDTFPLSDGKNSWDEVAQEALDNWNAQLSHVQFTTFGSTQRGDGNN